jgi:hypothetical protein
MRHNPAMTVTFSDIQSMLEARQPLPEACSSVCTAIINDLHNAGTSLSAEWIQIIQRLAQLQKKNWPSITHPRVALYVSNYGTDLKATHTRLTSLSMQQDPLTRLCTLVNADLRVYELDLTQEIQNGITEEEASHALSYGLMAVEEHVDCLVVDTLATGSYDALDRWHALLLKETDADPLQLLLQAKAGHDVFALMGAVFAARMAGIPIFGGARLGSILPLALAQIFGNEQDIFLILPQLMASTDTPQVIAGIQHLNLLLAMGPQTSAARTLVTPKAA